MKISNIVVALVIVFAVACTGKKTANEHGHEHDTEEHAHDDHQQQEEFTVNEDSVEVVTDSTTHTHEDGSSHHNQ